MSTFVPSSILGNLSCLARELLGACCWLRVVSVHGAVTLTEALNFLSSQQMEVCRLHGWKIPRCDFSHFKWNCLSSFPRGGQAWKESWRLSSSHELCYTQAQCEDTTQPVPFTGISQGGDGLQYWHTSLPWPMSSGFPCCYREVGGMT